MNTPERAAGDCPEQDPMDGIAGRISILFPRRRKTFTKDLIRTLDERFREKPIILRAEPEKPHYVAFSRIAVEDTILSREIAVSFSVQDEPRTDLKRLEDLIGVPLQEHTRSFTVELKPGTEIIGPQIFFFTFTSFEAVEKNITRFLSFIEDGYVPMEAAREEYRRRAKELKEIASEVFG